MDRLGYSGHIKIVSDSGKLNLDVKNTVTHLFEELVAHCGIERLFCAASPIEAGSTALISNACRIAGSHYYNDNNNDYGMAVYFLNLSSAEKAALTADSKVLPVYDSSLLSLDSSKIVGWATMKPYALNSKEGYLIPLDGISLINHRRHGVQWRWDADVMSGSFNTIAVGMNVCNNSNIFNGLVLQRGLEQNNCVLGDAEANGYYMIPNVHSEDNSVVWTAANEMLLGGHTSNDYNKARYVLNLDTGEQTLLDSSDNRYDLPLVPANCGHQIVFGDYLLQQNGNYIYTYNIKTKAPDSVYSNKLGMFVYNNYCYIANSVSSANKTITFKALDNTLTEVSSANITVTIPDVMFESSYTRIYNYGSNFILTIAEIGTQNTSSYPNIKTCSVVFSNLSDIAGSIVEILPKVQGRSSFLYNNVPFFMDCSSYAKSDVADKTSYYLNASGSNVAIQKDGLRFTTEGMFGNLFSFKVLEQDQTIPTGEGVKLQYYYTFEQ